MNPDSLIVALEDEKGRLDPAAPDHAERQEAIETELAHARGLPKLEVRSESPTVVVDHRLSYLRGLEAELERAEEERKGEIVAEIVRVKTELSNVAAALDGSAVPADEASVEPVTDPAVADAADVKQDTTKKAVGGSQA
jgi:hypothetical protein